MRREMQDAVPSSLGLERSFGCRSASQANRIPLRAVPERDHRIHFIRGCGKLAELHRLKIDACGTAAAKDLLDARRDIRLVERGIPDRQQPVGV